MAKSNTNTLLMIGAGLVAVYIFTKPKAPIYPYGSYPPGYIPPTSSSGGLFSLLGNLFHGSGGSSSSGGGSSSGGSDSGTGYTAAPSGTYTNAYGDTVNSSLVTTDGQGHYYDSQGDPVYAGSSASSGGGYASQGDGPITSSGTTDLGGGGTSTIPDPVITPVDLGDDDTLDM